MNAYLNSDFPIAQSVYKLYNVYLEIGRAAKAPEKPVETVPRPEADNEEIARSALSRPLRVPFCRRRPRPVRRVALADLERSRPHWLLRSLDTFPIDHIPQAQLVPLIERYIADHYEAREQVRGALLLERVR